MTQNLGPSPTSKPAAAVDKFPYGPPRREAEPKFSQPVRQILSLLLVMGLTGAGMFLAAPSVLPVFEANLWINGGIIFVFAVGVLVCFWQVVQLVGSVRWIERFARSASSLPQAKAPSMLAPLATLLRERGAHTQIGASSARSILDSVATRIDEAREITRYIVSLLIFLGLLGTFYGLATTVPALVDTIRSLVPKDGEGGAAVFARLMNGLEGQLSGMGVAFSTSLLGLAGSLVVGLLELFVGHGQNRFYRELEEWLSTITRLGFSTGDGESASETAVVTQLLERMTEQVDMMQQVYVQSELGRQTMDDKLASLTGSVERLSEQIGQAAAGNTAMAQLASSQDRLVTALENLERSEGLDPESRMRLRSIDVQMLRILEEMASGRQESFAELHTDLLALTRAMSDLNGRLDTAMGR